MEAAGKRYLLHPSRSDVFTLWAVGDIHLGNPGCDRKRCRRDLTASLTIGAGPRGINGRRRRDSAEGRRGLAAGAPAAGASPSRRSRPTEV